MDKGSKVIEIFRIPNNYCHHNEFMIEYKYYYRDYGDIEFKVISANEWIENRSNEKNAQIQPQQ